MKPYDVNKMMGQLKKAQIEKVVQCGFEDGALYNDELLKLTDIDLVDFKNLKGIIGKTKAMPKSGDIDVNKQGFTNEEYAEKEKIENEVLAASNMLLSRKSILINRGFTDAIEEPA